jgi:hypothetical protein
LELDTNISNQSDEMRRGVLDTHAAQLTHLFVQKAKGEALLVAQINRYTHASGRQRALCVWFQDAVR